MSEAQYGDSIYTAAITHKYGVDFFAAATKELLNKEIASYVEEWWSDSFDGESAPEGKTDSELIDLYFHGEQEEALDVCESTPVRTA